jgi:hypothetical protein
MPTSDASLAAASPSISGKDVIRKQDGRHQPTSARPRGTAPETTIPQPPALVSNGLLSSGQPLDSATRAYFEPRFGHDFSRVRVHSDARASEFARLIDANAYTTGRDIVFGADRFAPGTTEGRRLIAHELTHVVQQSDAHGAGGTAVPATSVQRDSSSSSPLMSPDNLIDTYRPMMIRGDFESAAQGLFTNFIFRSLDAAYVISFFKKLPHSWEDNVAALFTEKLYGASLLDTIAGSSHGRAMLTVLYEAMITGDVSAFERGQSERILAAKTRQMKPEDFVKAETRDFRGNATQIFPVRFMRVTPGYDDAPLMAKLTPDGKVRVNYPGRVKDSRMFAAEIRTLRGGTFLSEGQTLNPNEIVGIKDYEQGGETVYRPALALIDYSNRVEHSTRGKIVQVSIAAATMGLSAPAAGVEAAGTWAARLALADRIANVIQVVSFFVGENRDWLIEKLGPAGRLLVRASEIADSAVAIYGLGRLGQAGFKIASDLRAASKAAREKASTLTELNAADLKKIDNIDSETEKLVRELEAGAVAPGSNAAGVPAVKAEGAGAGGSSLTSGPLPKKPPSTSAVSPSAELNVPGPHPFFKKPAANQNALPLADSQAAESRLAATGTDDVAHSPTIGAKKTQGVTHPGQGGTRMGPKPKPGKLAEGSAKPLHTSESTTTKRLAPASTEKGKGGWAFNPKVDARVQTHDQAVQEAFRRTGVPLDEFKVTKVGKTADGKTIPVEWEVTSGPNRGAQVNIDDPTIVPTKEGPQVPHVGYQMPGKRSGGKALRGHIFPEEGVLASRGGLGTK